MSGCHEQPLASEGLKNPHRREQVICPNQTRHDIVMHPHSVGDDHRCRMCEEERIMLKKQDPSVLVTGSTPDLSWANAERRSINVMFLRSHSSGQPAIQLWDVRGDEGSVLGLQVVMMKHQFPKTRNPWNM
jgi:hypothetical protein